MSSIMDDPLDPFSFPKSSTSLEVIVEIAEVVSVHVTHGEHGRGVVEGVDGDGVRGEELKRGTLKGIFPARVN